MQLKLQIKWHHCEHNLTNIFTSHSQSTQFHIDAYSIINNKQNKSTNFPKLSSSTSSSFLIQIKHFNHSMYIVYIYAIKKIFLHIKPCQCMIIKYCCYDSCVNMNICTIQKLFYMDTQTKIFFAQEYI